MPCCIFTNPHGTTKTSLAWFGKPCLHTAKTYSRALRCLRRSCGLQLVAMYCSKGQTAQSSPQTYSALCGLQVSFNFISHACNKSPLQYGHHLRSNIAAATSAQPDQAPTLIHSSSHHLLSTPAPAVYGCYVTAPKCSQLPASQQLAATNSTTKQGTLRHNSRPAQIMISLRPMIYSPSDN